MLSPLGYVGIVAKTILDALKLYYEKYDETMPLSEPIKLKMTDEIERRMNDYMMFRECKLLGRGHEVDDPFFIDIS